MIRFAARALPVFLVAQLGVYILLPFFGNTWHNVVPEHDHYFLGGAQAHFASHMDSTELDVAAAGASRLSVGFGGTVVHAFNPAEALLVFAIVMGFSALTVLVIPRGLSQRVVPAALFLRSPLLLPLVPPPVA
jgi:hypothetical protein